MAHPADPTLLPPAVLAHLLAASSALILGPFVLWARKGSARHRGLGLVWIALMLAAAATSLFIHGSRLPNLAGYSPIHLLTLLTFVMVSLGFWAILQRQVARHQRAMRGAYLGGCVGAGLFALMPGRYLGDLVWHHTLQWV